MPEYDDKASRKSCTTRAKRFDAVGSVAFVWYCSRTLATVSSRAFGKPPKLMLSPFRDVAKPQPPPLGPKSAKGVSISSPSRREYTLIRIESAGVFSGRSSGCKGRMRTLMEILGENFGALLRQPCRYQTSGRPVPTTASPSTFFASATHSGGNPNFTSLALASVSSVTPAAGSFAAASFTLMSDSCGKPRMGSGAFGSTVAPDENVTSCKRCFISSSKVDTPTSVFAHEDHLEDASGNTSSRSRTA
mmetsp:Transcript_92950/g.233665  ORF Transcript_92950/g.233665 Transcript_92950/m.233665 type:complete len:247 (-) Transcript_92950:73-813(-)